MHLIGVSEYRYTGHFNFDINFQIIVMREEGESTGGNESSLCLELIGLFITIECAM